MPGRRIKKAEGFVWIGMGIVVCLISWKFQLGSFHEPGSGFLGFIAGLFVSLVGLIMVLPRFLSKAPDPNDSSSGSSFRIASWPRLAYTMALLLVYGLLLEPLGYVITTFLVMWGLFYDRHRSNLVSSCFASLVSVGATYLVFEIWLLCQFPRGIFPWW